MDTKAFKPFYGSIMDDPEIEAMPEHGVRPGKLVITRWDDGYVFTLFDTASDVLVFHGCMDMTTSASNTLEAFTPGSGAIGVAAKKGMMESEDEIFGMMLNMTCMAVCTKACGMMAEDQLPYHLAYIDVPLPAHMLNTEFLDSMIPDAHELAVFSAIDKSSIT